ncbi:MAG TPA: hypothetical protein PLV92_15255, partial [Pirellulaceae bacterium]|nr:hypothetical protein [Pirellulaceae bacterium]
DAAADLLAGALAGNEPPRGLGSHRRDAATKLLLDAAAAQRKPADTQFVEWMKSPYKSAAAATKAQGWLQVAKRVLGANQVDGTFAVALWHMTRPDPALAGNLAGQLVAAAPLNAWQRESAPLLYVDLKARRDSLDGLRAAAALVRLAHLESQANPTKAVDPLALHGELIAPLLKLAASATPSEAQRPWLAALYAAEGRLLRTHRYENWGFDDVDKKAEADYGQALLFDPQPDYYVGRGVARLRLSRSDPALLKSAEDDARAALRGDAEHAQAHALLGNIFISQSRREGNEAARTKLLEAAVAECTIAIERAGEVETERANHLINRSAAYLEWANFSFDPTLKRQAELLSRARDDADAATKLVTAYRDQAYRALGNAEEDLAWIAKQADHWRPAVDAFSSAIEQREDLPFAWMDRGRCYYKWVVYGGADKELLDQNAAPDLESAIRLSQVASRNELLAESHYWLGQVHAQMNRADDAAASFKAAIAVDANFHPALYLLGALNANLRKFDEADEAFGRAVKAAGDAGSVQRLAYIYSWSLTFDPFEAASVDAERRKRLTAVGETLKSDLPGNSAAEVDLLAGSILELSGDREQAIARYGQGLARAEAQPQVRSLLASRRAMAYWFDVQSRYADYQKSIGKPEAAAKMQALEKAVKEARARVLPDLELARKQMQAASAIVVVDEAELAGRTAFVRQQLNRLVAGSKRFGDPDPDAIKQVVAEYSDALALKPTHPKAWGWHLNLVRAWDEQKPLAPTDPRFPAALDHLRDAIAGVTDKTEKERIDAYRETLR